MGSRTATIGGSQPVPPPGWARLTDRIVARVRARAIDDKLLNGSVRSGSPAVLVRRARLLHRRYRSAVAEALRALIADARSNRPNFYAAKLPLRVRDVLTNAPLILTLADEVEQEEAVSPRGVILAERLVTDGDSPVYGPAPVQRPREETVESAVRHARAALHLG
ncbi:MAG TPA: hypothetical protein VLB79_11465 [Solirubrobacterales bacterium]|nr:hypothetical protein [Solirubrobacterales bacterium]